MTARTAVVLFARDLRVHDHDGLASAAATHERVAPLFVLDDAILDRLDAPGRLSFLFGALEDLRESLRALGADLILRRGDPVAETLRVARDGGRRHRRRRPRRERPRPGARGTPRARVPAARLELRVAGTTSIVPPGALTPQGRDHYRVFTPYWRRWREAPRGPLAATPARLRLPRGLEPGELPAPRARGGESAGRRQLDRWLAGGLAGYRRDGDGLDPGASSRLGAYLHLGCVSARELAARAAEHDGAEAFLRQLCWRDFFLQLLAANPRLPRDDLHPRGDAWLDDADALARWREGATGYPLVDAAMRQLAPGGLAPEPGAPGRRLLPHEDALPRLASRRRRLLASCWSTPTSRATSATGNGRPAPAPTRGRTASSTRSRRRGGSIPTGRTCGGTCPSSPGSPGRPCTSRGRRRAARAAPRIPAPIVDRAPAHARFRAARRELPGSVAREPDGWRSTERRRDDGAVESEQRALGTGPAVELSELGARELGASYWRELSRTSARSRPLPRARAAASRCSCSGPARPCSRSGPPRSRSRASG